MSSIQTDTRIASPGMVIKYDIRLVNTDEARTRERTLSNLLGPWSMSYNPFEYYYTSPFQCNKYSYLYDPDCYPLSLTWSGTQLIDYGSRTKRDTVYIVLQNGYFNGSCMIIRDSDLLIEGSSWFRFEMNNIVINESRCETALSIIDSETNNYLRLSNLFIVNSHNNILSVNIPSSYVSKVILTGETYFLSNQGSISLLSGTIEFEDFVLISDNIAKKYESVFQVSDSNQVYFYGEIMFYHNSGWQGGAISAYSSELNFEGNVSFIGNSADNGGAISLKEGAVINLEI
jgi:predicted outer membrane repeat protein